MSERPRRSPLQPSRDRAELETPVPSEGASAADLLGPKEVLETQQEGRAAAAAGRPVTACPWRDASGELDRARRDMWVRGYAAGRTELRSARASGAAAAAEAPSPPPGLSSSPLPTEPGEETAGGHRGLP